MFEEMLNRLGEIHGRATVKSVFGEPYQVNGRTIIPVAKVSFGFGFGGGRGTAKGDRPQGSGDGETGAGGAGGGAGGRVSVRPVAVLEVGADGTKVRPIVDVLRLALAGMMLAAWNIFWISYTIRRVRPRQQGGFAAPPKATA